MARTREQHRQYAENYRKAHPERYREQVRRYRAENLDNSNRLSRENKANMRASDPTGVREREREYHERWKTKDPAHVRQLSAKRAAEYRRRHPERVSAAKKAAYQKLTVEDIKRWTLKRMHGLTLEEYHKALVGQDGVCAICRKPETVSPTPRTIRGGGPTARSLAVDHCHASGKIRGLLCTSCNNGLGRFKDDPDLLESAAAYLRLWVNATV